MELTIKDLNSTVSIVVAKDLLKTIPYFEALLSFENAEDIIIEASNAQIMSDVILNKTTREDYQYKLEVIRCQDFLGLDSLIPLNLSIPIESFHLLLEIADLIGFSDDVVELIYKNLPQTYDFSSLPQDLIQKLIFKTTTYKLVSGSSDGSVKIWDIEKAEAINTYECGSNVWSVSVSPDSRYIAAGDSEKNIKIWDVESNTEINILTSTSKTLSVKHVQNVIYSPDGLHIASNTDGNIEIWDLKTDNKVVMIQDNLHKSLNQHNNHVRCINYSLDGSNIISTDPDNNIKIWDTKNFTLKHTLTDSVTGIRCIQYSPDNNFIATGNNDNSIKIWDVANGLLLWTLVGHTSAIDTIGYSPDGLRIVSASFDTSARIWNTLNGYLIHIFKHEKWVRCGIFTSDNKYVVSGSSDCIIRIWDATTCTLIKKIEGHDNWVNCLAILPYENDLVKKLKKYLL